MAAFKKYLFGRNIGYFSCTEKTFKGEASYCSDWKNLKLHIALS
jgi:hypothetical protein